MIRIRFFDITSGATRFEARGITASIDFPINQTPTFQTSVNLSDVDLEYLRTNKVGMEIYYRGKSLIGGICQQVPDPDKATLTLKGRQWIDLLYDERAWSQAAYKDQFFLLVLGQLLNRAGWRIGKINTVENKDAKTTIDLRQNNQLLSQVTRLIEDTPNMFYRYGGFINGKHSLDVGLFGENTQRHLIRGDQNMLATGKIGKITALKEDFVTTDIVREIEALGGDVQVSAAVVRAVNLGDALNAEPTLDDDPDFPIIVEVPNFVWYIRNNAIPGTRGMKTLQRYTQYAPEKTGAVVLAADINAAGLAMYQRAKAYLLTKNADALKITIEAEGDETLLPLVGDVIHVRASRTVDKFDPIAGTSSQISRQIDGLYRIQSVQVDLGNDTLNYSFTVTSGTADPENDEFVDLYDKQEAAPPAGVVYAPAFTPVMATVTTSVSGVGADTTMSDGTPGRLITLALPAAPGGSTGVYLAGLPYGTSPDGTPDIELVQDPLHPTTPIIARVNINDKWGLSNSITLNARIIWI